jgi:hypothetical protein
MFWGLFVLPNDYEKKFRKYEVEPEGSWVVVYGFGAICDLCIQSDGLEFRS